MRNLLAILLLVASLTACKSDQERAAESLASFAEAVVIHRAPYHAYALLDAADKQVVSVEAYATGFEEREPVFPAGTVITVGDVSLKQDRAEATVKITPPAGEPESRRYVLRRDGTKWRIWLGLADLEAIRTALSEAQRLADDGAGDQAREKLEAVAEKGFAASVPEVVEREIQALRQRLGNEERVKELDAQFKAAMAAELAPMKQAHAELAQKVGPDDEAFFPRLQALRAEIDKLERQAAIEAFQIEDVRARQYRDAWGLFREVRFRATNNTGRTLSKLSVRLELRNEGSDTPLGTAVWQLIEEGAKLLPNSSVDVKREVEKAPEDWKGREVVVRVEELQFADGGVDDAG